MQSRSMKLGISSSGKRINFSAFVQHGTGRKITAAPSSQQRCQFAAECKITSSWGCETTGRAASCGRSRKEGNAFGAVEEQG